MEVQKKEPTMKQPAVAMPEFSTKPRKNNLPYRNWNNEAGSSPSRTSPPGPKPAELIEHYVAQGMDKGAASEMVIEDLQAALQRSMYPMQRLISLEKTFRSSASKFEAAAQRISVIEANLESKPNMPQVFAAGVAAGAFLQVAAKSMPVIFGTFNDILGNIRRTFQK